MEHEYKTLRKLNVKPGDVVEYSGRDGGERTVRTVAGWRDGRCYHTDQTIGGDVSMNSGAVWRIVSRNNILKLWRDMTPEEKGALLLAHHEGRVIEVWQTFGHNVWRPVGEPQWDDCSIYRVRPEGKAYKEKFTVHSFSTMEEANSFADKLMDAFAEMPEADGHGALAVTQVEKLE